ncbi:hypothetical protein ES707_21887 [subsurface metagenome]
MVAFDDEEEAYFVCGCLNSVLSQLAVVGSIVLHPDTHVLRRVNIPRFSTNDRIHTEITNLSKECHAATARRDVGSLTELEMKLDRACGRLWGIQPLEIKSIRNCLQQIGVKKLRRRLANKNGE